MRKAPLALAAAVLLGGVVARAQVLPQGTLRYNFSPHPLVAVCDGDIQVSAENTTIAPQRGYIPLGIVVRNLGRTAQTVGLEFTSLAGGGGASARRDVQVEPGGRTAVVLAIPAGSSYGTLRVHAEGIRSGGSAQLYFTPTREAILALGTDPDFQALALKAPDTGSYNTMVRTFPPEEAPGELAAYVGFNEVVVLGPLESLSESARRALEAYAAGGGNLIVAQPPRAPAQYLPLLTDARPGRHAYGFGWVRLCGDDPLTCANALSADPAVGVTAVKPSTGVTGAGSYAYAAASAPPESDRFLLPQATAPVGRFLLIILAFTLAIGPGSVWVARRRGPPMLLLTIPGTALVTCLLIVGYSVVVDGFSIHAATRGYTLLDSQHKRAVSVGVEAFYANVAPGEARFGANTAVFAPPFQYNAQQTASVDWTHGATFGSDFIPSRTYREWGVISVEPTRARLQVRTEGGRIEVENALGEEIRVARLRLGGVEYVVRNVRDGGSAKAERVTGPVELPEGSLNPYLSRFEPRVLERFRAGLKEGEFVAQLDGPALLSEGGLRVSHHTAQQLVRGEVER